MAEPSSAFSDMSSAKQILIDHKNMAEFTKDGFKTLMESIKTSNVLPTGRDLDFYNTFDSFKRIINTESKEVLHLMNCVMKTHELENISNRILDEKIELIIESNDVILEKVANNIDELNGIRKSAVAPVILQTVSAELPVNGSWNKITPDKFYVDSYGLKNDGANCIKLITGKNIIRPQKFFRDKLDNRNNIAWVPRIKEKPNSLKPLAIFLEELQEREEYSHPYEFELDRFTPKSDQLIDEKGIYPKPISETELVEITQIDELNELLNTLRSCKEFAVDVEHHSYRSFMGFTCLLQISTNEKDYIIDALTLRDQLFILNEVFTKNTIVKVFHGADNDIEWLQRDLSIYVVNMFDTYQAAKALQYPALSLQFLLKKFCNIMVNKKFQLADWRIRPLPQDLKDYAREDTHYLLYIYRMLKRELRLKAHQSDNILKSVIQSSTEICKKRYFKPLLLDDSHLEIYRKCKKMFDNRQLYALQQIYVWRDNLAREEDESCGYVLPNHMLLQISETLPREMQGILACCNPVPPLVRSHLLELHHIILRAREQILEKAIMKDTTGPGVLKKISKINVDNVLHCPHDLSKSNEFRDDLPVLIDNHQLSMNRKEKSNCSVIEKSLCSLSVFSNSSITQNVNKKFKKFTNFTQFSPYARYQMVKNVVVATDGAVSSNKDTDSEHIKDIQGNERTDQERIDSIKDHYIQLSKKFSEELQIQQKKDEELQKQKDLSLLQMGGRKRKRQVSRESHIYNNILTDGKSSDSNNKGKQKKRQYTEVLNQDTQDQNSASPKKRKRMRNRQRKKQEFDQDSQLEADTSPAPRTQNKNKQSKRALKRANNNRLQKLKQQNTTENMTHLVTGQERENYRNPNQKKFNHIHQKKPNAKFRTKNQLNAKALPYDYASVDFRQFQGGADDINVAGHAKNNYKNNKKPANKKKKGGKKQMKDATFGNVATNLNRRNNRN